MFERFGPEVPVAILKIWAQEIEANFIYSTVALVIGGLLGFGLLGGFVYLLMHEHATAAGWLLGSGTLSMVAGFLTTRLWQRR